MNSAVKLSHTAALILQTISQGYCYGFDIMDVTGLPSGTVYPALRRLERDGVVQSKWEGEALAQEQDRPPRKYYRLTRLGQGALLSAVRRYPLLEQLAPEAKTKSRQGVAP
jgi:PadR family transcriptional regulator, regulatory protein PadR